MMLVLAIVEIFSVILQRIFCECLNLLDNLIVFSKVIV